MMVVGGGLAKCRKKGGGIETPPPKLVQREG